MKCDMPVYQIRHATKRMLLIAYGLQSAHNTNDLRQAVNNKNLHKPHQPHNRHHFRYAATLSNACIRLDSHTKQ